MNSQRNTLVLHISLISVLLVCLGINYYNVAKAQIVSTRIICVDMEETVRARQKKCLLRPDTGPCRADILSYYYDGKQKKCYAFFYGGCQGNGNNFKTRTECLDQCYLPDGSESLHRPYFCSLPFEYGDCFGQYNRWGWDPKYQICKQRLYSGCGGNQNNFETKKGCMATCLYRPNNTMNDKQAQLTTCIPYTLSEFN